MQPCIHTTFSLLKRLKFVLFFSPHLSISIERVTLSAQTSCDPPETTRDKRQVPSDVCALSSTYIPVVERCDMSIIITSWPSVTVKKPYVRTPLIPQLYVASPPSMNENDPPSLDSLFFIFFYFERCPLGIGGTDTD